MSITLKQFRELTKDLPEETEIKTLIYSDSASSCKRAVIANYKNSTSNNFICLNAMGTHLPDEWKYFGETND
jgi:hypothetical protein